MYIFKVQMHEFRIVHNTIFWQEGELVCTQELINIKVQIIYH